MMNLKAAFALLFAVVVITSCKKYDSLETVWEENKNKAVPSNQFLTIAAPDIPVNFDSLRATLPVGAVERFEKSRSLLLNQNPEFGRFLVQSASAVAPTPCSQTPLNAWLNNQLADWNNDVYYYAVLSGMLNLPTHDALYFENSHGNSAYGIRGEYTQTYDKTFKDLKRFWEIETANIVTVPIHGRMLQSRDKIIRINKLLYGNDQATAEYWADLIAWLLAHVPQYRNGNHPIFSFNAYSQASFDFAPLGTLPSKIALGDGLIAPYVDLGFGDVAPQAILAHEYGHQVQFQEGVFKATTIGPDFIRTTELMADAFAAYYLSHARGASMQWKRVKQFLQVFYNMGDCYFDNPAHHGTPEQRMAAAEWGYQLADDAQKQGHVLSNSQVIALFNAKLPSITGRQ
jgi:hypothetical protein